MSGFPLLLTVAGPALTAVGAFMLAYDVLRGPAAWYLREFFGARSWDLLLQHHEKDIERLRALPVPRYTPAEVERLVREAEARFKEIEWQGKERIRGSEISELHRAQRLALWGLLLVGVGSLCQSVGAWMGRS